MERTGCALLGGIRERARCFASRHKAGVTRGGFGKGGGEVRVHGYRSASRRPGRKLPGDGRSETRTLRHGKPNGEEAVCGAEPGAGGAGGRGNETVARDL